jgi:Leucine-rich repeat (LRR) protein
VSTLTRLRELHLEFNQITDLSGLEKLPELRLLSLRSNGSITPEMVSAIATRSTLRQLWVGHCGLTEVPDAFRDLEQLEEIYIFGNPLTAIPDWLPAMPNLKRLGLVNAATDATKDELRARHPHLEIR